MPWPDSVSQETNQKLTLYHELLLKWQAKINLIGPETMPQAKIRHFDDSGQLTEFFADCEGVLYDLGSGAGFPGLVLAILCPQLKVTLIESDSKKCAFLTTVSRETATPVQIINERIEQAALRLPPPDFISARALAPLSQLLTLSKPWILDNPSLLAVFPKGARHTQEIEEARLTWDFSVSMKPSETEREGMILSLSAIRPRVSKP